MTRSRAAALLAVLLVAAACSGGDDGTTAPDTPSSAAPTSTTAAAAGRAIVFSGQGNDLAAYEAEPPYTKQIVIPHHDEDTQPAGLDINGQICFDPEDPRRFVAGEDTLQRTTGEPGWGIFELDGDRVGELSARQVGKLVPTYQSGADDAENYGCGFLPDGRIVTTDVGNQAAGPGNGQLVVWFGPFDTFDVSYCKVDIELHTGQGVLVDGDYVYVAQARPPRAGIFRYAIDELPTSDTADGGCDGTDATGAPLATGVEAELFIEPGAGNTVATPNAIVRDGGGALYVSSVFNGVIAEFTSDGTYVRDVLAPPDGETLGAEPFSTGTPLGLGMGPDGSVYYADIGIVADETGIGPGAGTGRVMRIAFADDGTPLPPEVMDAGLAFPDGIGVWTP